MTVRYSDTNTARITSNGLLIEAARTNLLRQSQALDTSPWVYAKTTPPGDITRTENAAAAPDGTNTATKLDVPAVGAAEYVFGYQGIALSDVKYTYSMYLRGSSSTTIYLYVARVDGGSWVVDGTLACNLTTMWQRFDFTFTAVSGFTTYCCIGVDTRDGSQSPQSAQTVYAWGAQLETINSASSCWMSSYIPTTTTTVVRPADAVTLSNPLNVVDQQWIVDVVATPSDRTWNGHNAFLYLWQMGLLGQPNGTGCYSYGNTLYFSVYDHTTTIVTCSYSMAAWSDSISRRITCVYYGDGNLKMYADGVEIGSLGGAGTGILTAINSEIRLGNSGFNCLKDFKVANHCDPARL